MARDVRDAATPAPQRTPVSPSATTQDDPKARLAAIIAEAQGKVRERNQRLGSPLEEPPILPTVQVTSIAAPKGPSPEERRAEQAVGEVEAFSAEQVGLAGDLTRRSHEVYSFLHLLCSASARSKGQSLLAYQITVFCPGEVIRDALGLAHSTFYDALGRLKARGLVDYRGHRTTLNSWGNRCDGTLFAVKLRPERAGEARLHYDDLKASYRDLEADIEQGRTWYRIGQSVTWGKDIRHAVRCLLSWNLLGYTLPAVDPVEKPPFMTLQSAGSVELILDVLLGPKVERARRIELAARAVVTALGDGGSLNFWRRLLRGMVRQADAGRDYSTALHGAVQRAHADRVEGFARKAGALLITRLKQAGVYRELMAT